MIELCSLEGLARFQSIWRDISSSIGMMSTSVIHCRNQNSAKKLKVEKVEDTVIEIKDQENLVRKSKELFRANA